MDRSVVILLALPLLVTVCGQEEEESKPAYSYDETRHGQACFKDFCPSDPELQTRIGERLSDAEKEREIYESLTQVERRLFHSPADLAKEEDRPRPTFIPQKITYGTLTFSDKYTGVDNIIANFPQYKEVIENKIMPLMPPESYASLKLMNGCCPEFQFFRRQTSMVNIYTDIKTIVQFDHLDPPVYQYSYLGLCAEEGSLYGGSGHCLQGFAKSMFLVPDAERNVTFDLFNVPAFCKCYQISD